MRQSPHISTLIINRGTTIQLGHLQAAGSGPLLACFNR